MYWQAMDADCGSVDLSPPAVDIYVAAAALRAWYAYAADALGAEQQHTSLHMDCSPALESWSILW